MSLQPIYISNPSGLVKNKKPFAILDQAFQELENAYCWRERIKKREGIKLIGRLRRILVSEAQADADGTSDYDIADILAALYAGTLRTVEPNAILEPGSVVIRVDPGGLNETEFTDQEDGTFLRTSGTAYDIDPGTFINYITGQIHIEWDAGGTPPAATSIEADFNYFPMLPVMGIDQREVSLTNNEPTVYFDTRHNYAYSGQDFSNPSSTIWAGSDSEFFWMSNYRGADPTVRLFFVTNGSNPASSTENRIRYTTDAVTWTDHTPAIAGTNQTNETVGTLTNPWVAFAGNLTQTPVIPGSVVITVSNGTDPTVTFRDTITTYPNGTLNGSPPANTGTIDYSTGAITLTMSPAFTVDATVTATYQNETSFIFQALLIVPYYGRFLYLNTWEGATAGASTNFFNRCRFSQTGNPIERQAWVTTIFGRGGFIDAPTAEKITSARFFKNTLIVFFERTTWQLRYVGEYGLPFIWERISSDFGSESKLSTILFDNGVLAVGDKAIVTSSGNDVQRIDLDIPDAVFNFRNANEGHERVAGIRDFKKEVVFWCYGDGSLPATSVFPTATRVYPNKTLLYNYRNNTWATFRDNVTAFGQLNAPNGINWDTATSWDSETTWDDTIITGEPLIVCGNQQGYIHLYQLPSDFEVVQESLVDFIENESLAITEVADVPNGTVRLTIPNHNLESQEHIYLAGLLYIDTTDSTPQNTTMNNRFYQIAFIDLDTVDIYQWNPSTQNYDSIVVDVDGTYIGGGQVVLLPVMSIITKDFSPYGQQGQQFKSSYTDFMTDATPDSAISVNVNVNANGVVQANLPVWNSQVETSLNQLGNITGITLEAQAVVTSPNHSLKTGRSLTIENVQGMTQINGFSSTITFLTLNTFRLNDINSTAFTPYTQGGNWWTNDTNSFYSVGAQYAWHRFYATVYGQFISYQLTYDDNLINQETTQNSEFELNAMAIYVKPGGRMV